MCIFLHYKALSVANSLELCTALCVTPFPFAAVLLAHIFYSIFSIFIIFLYTMHVKNVAANDFRICMWTWAIKRAQNVDKKNADDLHSNVMCVCVCVEYVCAVSGYFYTFIKLRFISYPRGRFPKWRSAKGLNSALFWSSVMESELFLVQWTQKNTLDKTRPKPTHTLTLTHTLANWKRVNWAVTWGSFKCSPTNLTTSQRFMIRNWNWRHDPISI